MCLKYRELNNSFLCITAAPTTITKNHASFPFLTRSFLRSLLHFLLCHTLFIASLLHIHSHSLKKKKTAVIICNFITIITWLASTTILPFLSNFSNRLIAIQQTVQPQVLTAIKTGLCIQQLCIIVSFSMSLLLIFFELEIDSWCGFALVTFFFVAN